jgi:ABC-type uncharacterized transport system auxiliary subunit
MKHSQTICLGFFLACLLCGCGSNPVWKRESFAFTVPADPPASNSSTNIVVLRRVIVSPLFKSSSFTYRTAEDAYEQDPYAGFLVPPDRALTEPILAGLRAGGAFGRVAEPGSGLAPSIIAEATVTELDGDLRNAAHPVAEMEIHFIVYEAGEEAPGRVLLDKVCESHKPMDKHTPAALIAAWDADLHEITDELNSEYAKANPHDR